MADKFMLLNINEIKILLDTMPNILKTDVKRSDNSLNNNTFSIFEELPEDVRLKIGKISTTNFITTNRSYTNLYNDLMYKKGPTIWEFNNYIKNLQKSTPALIGLFGIFYSKSVDHYLCSVLCSSVELLNNNKLKIIYGNTTKTLLNHESFIDYFIIQGGLRDDYELIDLFFDVNTINAIAANRKKFNIIDPFYTNKFTYAYTYLLFEHFAEYFALLGTAFRVVIFGNNEYITNNLYNEIDSMIAKTGTYFFIGKNTDKIMDLVDEFLSELAGDDNIFVDIEHFE